MLLRRKARASTLAKAVCSAVVFLAAPAHAQAPQGREPAIVTTSSGPVVGVPSASGFVYKGLPYAAAPEGELRWRSPVPPQPWTGVRVADTFGSPCAQAPRGEGQTAISSISRENCLTLNVWTPTVAAASKLPVMVWIHGGGFATGMGSSPTYDGAKLAGEGVIVVTLNYRVGVFGFLAHPELTAESRHKSSGNFGLEDQLAALRWVAANIAAFGGDPANVTLFGQSAGGASVLGLATSKQAAGLFSRAIIQSGAARGAMAVPSLATAEQQGLAFAAGQPIAALRRLRQDAVLKQLASPRSAVRLGPVQDGYMLAGDPAAAVAQLQGTGVALLIGSNAREGLGAPPEERLDDDIRSAFGPDADQALALYGRINNSPGTADPLLGTAAQQFSTDSTFRCGSVEVAQRAAAADLPVWQYQFEHFVPGREAEGAAHSFEVPYVFGNLLTTGFSAAAYGAADRSLSNVMVRYWANFAKHGDPNGPGLPVWPRYTVDGKDYLRLSSAFPTSAQADADLRGPVCRLFPSHPSVEK